MDFSYLFLFAKKFAYKAPANTKIKAIKAPTIINKKIFSNLKFAAGASGPGVGGTNT